MCFFNVYQTSLTSAANGRTWIIPSIPLITVSKKFTGFIGIFFEFSTNINSNPKPITVGI